MHGEAHGLLGDVLSHAHQLGLWSYLALALLVMLEGPVATLVGAAAASLGLMNVWLVFAAAALGNLTGDVLWYELGRQGRDDWIVRHGRWMGLTRDRVRNMEEKIRREAPRIIFIAKVTLFFSVPALLAAGISRVRLRRWLPIDLLGETLWTGTLVAVGFFFSSALQRLEEGFRYAAVVGFVVIVPAVLYAIKRYGRQWADRPA